jgi:outer membrane protein assembly factor BamB
MEKGEKTNPQPRRRVMKLKTFPIILAVVSLTCLVLSPAQAAQPGAVGSASCRGCGSELGAAWPMLHSDTRNSDYVPIAGPRELIARWHALDGKPDAAVVTVGPEGNRYTITMDSGPCNLHAFDRDGNLLWCSDAIGPTFGAPVVGDDGAVFVHAGDYSTAELLRFESDGTLTWQVPIEAPGLAPMLTPDGSLLTLDINGLFRAFDPDTGESVVEPFQLPAAPLPVTPPAPYIPLALQLIGMDPAFTGFFYDAWQGSGLVVGNNAPAVDPVTGRIFMVAQNEDGTNGKLYAMDFVPPVNGTPGAIEPACSADMGPGSATSPALSEDGAHVYASDETGALYAFDTGDCGIAWQITPVPGSALASPTVGPNGRIYFLASGKMVALADGGDHVDLLWELDATDLVDPDTLGAGTVGRFDSVIPAAQNYVYAAATVGQQITPTLLIPAASLFATVAPEAGEIVSSSFLGEQSAASPSIAFDGMLHVPSKPLVRGVVHALMTLGIVPAPPFIPPQHAGVYAFEAACFEELSLDGLGVARDFSSRADAALEGSDLERAEVELSRAMVQLGVVRENLERANEKGEILFSTENLAAIQADLARTSLALAQAFKEKRFLGIPLARLFVNLAMGTIDGAVSVLEQREVPEPPGQPASGPGGSDYPYPDEPIVSGVGVVGGYTIYEPNPRPEQAPVVALLHGNCVSSAACNVEDVYDLLGMEDLATHLAKKGNIVVYTRHQDASTAPLPSEQTQAVLDSIGAALDALEADPESAQPDRDRFGIVGHSRGGYLAINAAARLGPKACPIRTTWSPSRPERTPTAGSPWKTGHRFRLV